MNNLINTLVYSIPYPILYLGCFAYFVFLYFGLAPLFQKTCKWLYSKGILEKIEEVEYSKDQLKHEILHSSQSILLFGFSVIPIIYCIRMDLFQLLPDTPANILIGIVALTLWNEIHFFTVHRIMHLKFFMKHVHRVHHKSRVPSVYSVFSFHWLEAFLLSTVPFTLFLIIPISMVAVFIYPLVSILLNYAGHCNYRFGDGKGDRWTLFATHHNQHHARGRKNYGFAINILDKIFSKHNHNL